MKLQLDDRGRIVGYEREEGDSPGLTEIDHGIDPKLEIFLYGQCHALALVLHEATGWPIVSIDGGDHYAVQAPDGKVVDIKGAHDIADIERQWGVPVVTSRNAVWHEVHLVNMEEPDLEFACEAAPAVLAALDHTGLDRTAPAVTPPQVRRHEPLGPVHVRILEGAYCAAGQPYLPSVTDLPRSYSDLSTATRQGEIDKAVKRLQDNGFLTRTDRGLHITPTGTAAYVNAVAVPDATGNVDIAATLASRHIRRAAWMLQQLDNQIVGMCGLLRVMRWSGPPLHHSWQCHEHLARAREHASTAAESVELGSSRVADAYTGNDQVGTKASVTGQ